MSAHCAKCGACLSVCPVYQHTLLERLAPRGKHALLKDGEADFSWKSVQDTVSACLQCGACGAQCSAGIKVDKEILLARAENMEFAPAFPLLWKLFGSDTAWSGAEKMLLALPSSSGIIYRLASLALSNGSKSSVALPPPAPAPLLSSKGMERIAAASRLAQQQHESIFEGMRIALFSGCVQNFIYPEIPEAMTRWFPGAKIIIPKGQCCCGLPALSAGAVDAARNLIRRNIKAFSAIDADFILTGCASCSYMMRKWNEICDDSRVQGFTGKLREFTEVADPTLSDKAADMPMPVAFHAPCHSRFATQGIGASKKFIKDIAGQGYSEIEQGCCGHGGSFSMRFPDISGRIFRERISALERCGAKAIVTTCSGCLLQWRMKLSADVQHSGIKVLHAAELSSFFTNLR